MSHMTDSEMKWTLGWLLIPSLQDLGWFTGCTFQHTQQKRRNFVTVEIVHLRRMNFPSRWFLQKLSTSIIIRYLVVALYRNLNERLNDWMMQYGKNNGRERIVRRIWIFKIMYRKTDISYRDAELAAVRSYNYCRTFSKCPQHQSMVASTETGIGNHNRLSLSLLLLFAWWLIV